MRFGDHDPDRVRHDREPGARPGTIIPFDRGRDRPAHLRLVAADRPPRRVPRLVLIRPDGDRTDLVTTLTSFGPPPTSPTATDHHRAARSAPTTREQRTMYATNLSISHIHAESRRQEMLAEAERNRLLRQAAAAAPQPRPTAALRRAVGAALVRLGQHVQGAAPAPAADALAGVSSLRAAR